VKKDQAKGKKAPPFKGKETMKEERAEMGKKPMPMRNGGSVKGKRGC
jgi:hypothetical protein